MAFLLNRSAKQMVRLISSSWAAKPYPPPLPRVCLTSINNNNNNSCFSTAASSSPDDMKQEFNPEEIFADPAFKDMTANCREYIAKIMVDAIQNKPIPSTAEFQTFMHDQFKKLTPLDDETEDPLLETDHQAEKNPKATPEMIKASLDLIDTITCGFHKHLPRPDFKVKGEDFYFTLDTNGIYLTVNVSGLVKEHVGVYVVKDRILVTSRIIAPDQKVFEAMWLPKDYNYDPDEVTGTFMEDDQLMISFPVAKEGGEPKEKYFEVNLV